MYDININFLKRRKGNVIDKTTVIRKRSTPIEEKIPIIAGGVVLVLLPLAALGALFFVKGQITQAEKQNQDLDAEITQLQAQNAQIAQLDTQIQQAKAEVEALASVFNLLKPMSAVLADISANVPPGVQINSFAQSQLSPTEVQLTINGVAKDYNNVNDFLLSLQASPFLNPDVTKIESATAQDLKIERITDLVTLQEKFGEDEVANLPPEYTNPGNFPAGNNPEEVEIKYPQVVEYEIVTMLNNKPASELIEELTRKGAVGLVTRIEALKEQGVIQQ
ncbi:MAG: PilN domain-containing protein [Gomphosphaeria aponina SAG 52.96 = DSM 107014]|uniref:PilN domain-containing protein n=1 Tax=Gomphosphaeria aponina SAG 52.96 = DSM 107014 TaxID=1521640 RepID=A0A941GP03_9CHRO|nr:PilN domain-containing protein [Gomphosphaeria aponina SAG 52.96 = DSM 107014]